MQTYTTDVVEPKHPDALSGPDSVVLFGGLDLLRCFTEAGIPAMAVDSDPDSLTLRSAKVRDKRLIACPAAHPAEAANDLIAIGKTFKNRPLLAFDSDNMLYLVSRYRHVLEQYYHLLLPQAEVVESVVGKLPFAQFAQRTGIPVPRTLVPTEETTVEEIVAKVGLPCILKPDSHLGRFKAEVVEHEHRPHKALRVDTPQELEQKIKRMRRYCDSFLIQQLIPGGDDRLYSFHTCIARSGKPLGYFVGRKLRTYPRESGFSTCLRLVEEPEVVKLGLDLVARLNITGPIKIDFKRHEQTGEFYVLEYNPRFNLWNHLGARCGINLPAMAFADLRGEEQPIATSYRTDVKWVAFGNDVRGFLRDYRATGEWNWASWLWSLHGRRVCEVFSWSDPWPWMVTAGRYIEANLRKVSRIVHGGRGRGSGRGPVVSGTGAQAGA